MVHRLGLCAMLLMSAVGTSAANLPIAERGECGSPIVSLECERGDELAEKAAVELRHYVRRITGVEMTIDRTCWWKFWEASATPRVRLKVDGTREDLGEEGFALRVNGGTLEIIGKTGRGVLFGVYEILERFGGCGWYTSWYERVAGYITGGGGLEVPDDLDEVQVPAFCGREVTGADVSAHPEFALRNRCSLSGGCKFDPVLGKCHTFAALLSPEEHFEQHPEYFSEVNGKRRKVYTQLCLTNPEVVRLCTEKVLERIRASYDDGVRYYGVSQNDWYGYCTCANCRAIDEREGSHSGTLVTFVNQIAEAVEKEYPDVFIETLVYTYTRRPPKTLRFRKNVVPCFCTIECDFSRPIVTSRAAENVAVREAIREWGWKSSQMMVWDYTADYFHFLLTWPNVKSLAPNLRLFKDVGASMVLELGGGEHGDWEELKSWLLMKLMWNPYQDENKLLDRYFAAVYGPAARGMRAYFELVHTQFRDEAKMPMRCFDLPERCHIDNSTLRSAAKVVDWAAAQVAAPGLEAYATNVALTRLSLDYTRAIKGYGRFRLRRDAKDVDRGEFLSQQEGARRLVNSGVSLSQGNDPLAGVFLERFAKASVPTGGVTRLFVDARSFWRGGICNSAAEFVKDEEATAGIALRIHNTTFGKVGYFNFGMVDFEPKARVKVRARVKVESEKVGGESGWREDAGEAFSMGVWSLKENRGAVADVSKSLSEVPKDAYEWYDVGEWVPGEREFFWIAPGKFLSGEHCGRYKSVSIDGLELLLQ